MLTGPLLKNMIQHMKLKSKHALTPNRKVWMYSAHDETVANMLMTLNLFEPHCPPYTATILIELRINTQNEHVVTVSIFKLLLISLLIISKIIN